MLAVELREHIADELRLGSPCCQITGRVRDALLLVDDDAWTPAVDADGNPRPGAEVIELTDLDGEITHDGTFNLARTLH